MESVRGMRGHAARGNGREHYAALMEDILAF